MSTTLSPLARSLSRSTSGFANLIPKSAASLAVCDEMGGVQQRLGRNAADVETRPPRLGHGVDEGGRYAAVSRQKRGRIAAWAAAEDNVRSVDCVSGTTWTGIARVIWLPMVAKRTSRRRFSRFGNAGRNIVRRIPFVVGVFEPTDDQTWMCRHQLGLYRAGVKAAPWCEVCRSCGLCGHFRGPLRVLLCARGALHNNRWSMISMASVVVTRFFFMCNSSVNPCFRRSDSSNCSLAIDRPFDLLRRN